MSAAPYGAATGPIRRFLLALSSLDDEGRQRVVDRYSRSSTSPAFAQAERSLGELLERSGRLEERDALAGPLVQMTRLPTPPEPITPVPITAVPNTPTVAEADDGDGLHPVAEPALSALLALLTADLLSADHFAQLYDAFEDAIPRRTLIIGLSADEPGPP